MVCYLVRARAMAQMARVHFVCITVIICLHSNLKGTDHVGTFMGLKCVVYYANYRSGNQSSKIQVVP